MLTGQMRRSLYDLTNPGWMIASAIAVFTVVGIASIYVTDTHYASGHDGPANAAKQAVRVVLGLCLAAAALRIGYQHVGRYSYLIFLICLAGLVPLIGAKSMR